MKASLHVQYGVHPDIPMQWKKVKALGLHRHSCARLIGVRPNGSFDRQFLQPHHDHHVDSRAGLHAYYLLESGNVYEVQLPLQRDQEHHYFCMVSDAGDIVRLSEQEARRWLQRPSSDR